MSWFIIGICGGIIAAIWLIAGYIDGTLPDVSISDEDISQAITSSFFISNENSDD